jgi:hypothetical protein
MARERNQIITEGTEEICSVQHFYATGSHAGSIKIIIGTGRENADGLFEFDVPQQYESITIEGELYQAFIADHDRFNRDDLWGAVDQIRGGQQNV